MQALLPGSGDQAPLGLKIVSVRTANAEKGLPTVPATILMFDAETGLPSAVVEATWLTALRTAAGSAAATKLLAAADAQVLVVFGAGLQGEAHALTMLAARPALRKVVVLNRGLERAQVLCATLKKDVAAFSGVEVVAAALADGAAVEAAVREADIICTTTNSSAPLFDGVWMRAGCHINAIGSYTPEMQEIDESSVCRCRVGTQLSLLQL